MDGVILSRECSGDTIPLDLIIEIFTRLHPKSLKRFQCVSKEWLSIIQSQVFIDLFNSLSRTRSRFLVAIRNADNHVSLLSSSHNETERSTTSLLTELETKRHPVLVRFLRGACNYRNFDITMSTLVTERLRSASLHTNLQRTMSDLFVDLVHCASVHGIFCLSHPSYPCRFTICNPSTRQVITLPDIPSNGGTVVAYPDLRGSSPTSIMRAISLFLGYDPVGNLYKALCITGIYGVPCQEYKVLTLGGRNLSWRDIKGTKYLRHVVMTNGICINGIAYYGGWTSIQGKLSVTYCFDVRRETVSCVIPKLKLISCGSLINYNGKLGVVDPVSYNPFHSFDVDVLEYFDKDFKTYTWSSHMFNFHPSLTGMAGTFPLKVLGVNNASEAILSPVKLPPKDEPLYIYYAKIWIGKNFVRRVELEGFEEFGCNHTSGDKQCVCQLFISHEYFENLVSL